MRKTITLTESELIKIIKKIVFNDSVISEVNKVENFNEENPVYRYRDISVLRDDFRPNQIGSVYFMGVTYNGSEYVKPKKGVKVTFTGDKGDFTFNSNDIKITNTNPMIGVGDLTDDYKEKLIPYLKGKDKSSFSNNSINKEKNKDKFTSVEIKRALERAFRDYWVEETDDTTSGLRGIETIGEYLEKEMDYEGDTTEDWSVMNFFNTMTIPELITKKWDNDGRENRRTDWLTGVFKNDTEFLNTLLKTQWSSLYKGIYKIESSALSKLKKAYKGAEFITKQPGSKTDQYDGIDVEVKFPNGVSITIQIKSATNVKLEKNKYKIFTYGMNKGYDEKGNLSHILYNTNNGFYLFKNENYKVENGGKETTHYKKDLVKHYADTTT